MKTLLAVLLLALPVCAQDLPADITPESQKKVTLTISYESVDARQFSYSPWSNGAVVSLAYRFNQRWEGILAVELSDAQKAAIGNGSHQSGTLGARYYLRDAVFLVAGATVGRDKNDSYTKIAYRGFAGLGVKYAGIVGTVTAFAPPDSAVIDPNHVKGLALTVEYFRPLFGPVGAYAATSGSLASFNATGNPGERFSGASWRTRAGISLTF